MDASSASDGAGSRCVGGSAGGDGDSGRPECEAGIEEAVSCVKGRKIGHSKGTIYKNTKIENLDERHFYESVIESSKLMDYIFKEWNMINSVDMKGLVNYGKQN